jgi:hypothetical protein
MSSLLAPRPPGWRMREDEGQGALFGGEAVAPRTPTPFPRRERPAAPALDAPLAGPTLDDAVSRAWEGLVAGVPAACPVCHGEIEPALGGGLAGRCGTCHVTLD